MKLKLFDSELKIMETLWKHGDCTAGQMAKMLKDEIGWNRNTTYTVIKKCIDKGAVVRLEPNFLCRAAVTRQEIQAAETEELIDRMFDGSKAECFAAFLSGQDLSGKELDELKQMLISMEQEEG